MADRWFDDYAVGSTQKHGPIRGDELVLRTTVQEARVSRSKPDRGIVRTQVELINQDEAVVLSLLAMNLIRTRP